MSNTSLNVDFKNNLLEVTETNEDGEEVQIDVPMRSSILLIVQGISEMERRMDVLEKELVSSLDRWTSRIQELENKLEEDGDENET